MIDVKKHLAEIDNTIIKLHELAEDKSNNKSIQQRYITKCASNTVALLCGIANSAETTDDITHTRRVIFGSEDGWTSAVGAVHSSFYNSLVSHVEIACSELCAEKSIDVKIARHKSVDKMIAIANKDNILSNATNDIIKKETIKIVGSKPSFIDYVNAVMEDSKMSKKRIKIWRNYMESLNLLRNKSSHSNKTLSDSEVSLLQKSGFGIFLSQKNELQMSTGTYRQICMNTLNFFNELN